MEPDESAGWPDPLEELLPEVRGEIVAAVCRAWEVDPPAAEAIVRSSEPFWNVLEANGGADAWGGSEFCQVFPLALAFIRRHTNS